VTIRALVLALAACATSRPPASPRASTGVAPAVWRAHTLDDAGDGCEPWWLEPSVLCVIESTAEPMAYDDCHWRCRSPGLEQ
jgi:hypothetical protein